MTCHAVSSEKRLVWLGFKSQFLQSCCITNTSDIHCVRVCYRERNAPLQLLPLETVSFERSLTPQLCIDHCFRKGYPYSGTQISSVHFGTQQRSQCHCGDFKPSTEHKTDESQCSASCPGDQNNKCGGDWRISVYRTGVFRYNQTYADSGYKGCYNYDRRMLSQYKVDLVNNNSPVRCLGVCKGIGYIYAGLKSG
ncbi:xylosyltransferase oxt-like [Nilaparvata lugens]|uniref:xylosyltransferase oxt-like n=1 Tax=Nilaparvata lugens TaxID=108931 RepID=UPI00193CF223|nr:xylosyltransferase oxt-like [Nilaparvata lugens]